MKETVKTIPINLSEEFEILIAIIQKFIKLAIAESQNPSEGIEMSALNIFLYALNKEYIKHYHVPLITEEFIFDGTNIKLPSLDIYNSDFAGKHIKDFDAKSTLWKSIFCYEHDKEFNLLKICLKGPNKNRNAYDFSGKICQAQEELIKKVFENKIEILTSFVPENFPELTLGVIHKINLDKVLESLGISKPERDFIKSEEQHYKAEEKALKEANEELKNLIKEEVQKVLKEELPKILSQNLKVIIDSYEAEVDVKLLWQNKLIAKANSWQK